MQKCIVNVCTTWYHAIMENCIFCKIIQGTIPCHKIYEDETYFAFLDIFPRTKGHTLLVPKIHYQWVYDVPSFGEYWETAKKIALAAKKAMSANYVSFLTHGLDVQHAHIHIMPKTKDDSAMVPEAHTLKNEEMIQIAEKIKSKIAI